MAKNKRVEYKQGGELGDMSSSLCENRREERGKGNVFGSMFLFYFIFDF